MKVQLSEFMRVISNIHSISSTSSSLQEEHSKLLLATLQSPEKCAALADFKQQYKLSTNVHLAIVSKTLSWLVH